MARKIWPGWKAILNDIEFIRKSNGNRKRIGRGRAAAVYLARMKLRYDDNRVIDVAVKQFRVKRSEAGYHLSQFIRELFFQKHVKINISSVRLADIG